MTPALPQLVSRKDIAEMCSVRVRTVYNWEKRGLLGEPVKLAGNAIRYDAAEVRRGLNLPDPDQKGAS